MNESLINKLSHKESMRGLFFVVKGQYLKDVVRGTHTLGYDPYNPLTKEWYMVVDSRTFTCISCGSNLEEVLQSVYRSIKRNRGSVDKYLSQLEKSFSVTSPIMRDVYEEVYHEYGAYFEDRVREMEDLAYEELQKKTLSYGSKKALSKYRFHRDEFSTPTKEKEEVSNTPTLLAIKPKKMRSFRKLSL